MDVNKELCTNTNLYSSRYHPEYHCHTCCEEGTSLLAFVRSICFVCATKCHRGHKISYSQYSESACECNQPLSPCKALAISPPKPVNVDSPIFLVKNSNADKTFECPVCLKYMCASIYQCEMGHNVCGECKEKIASCAICRMPLTEVRNRGLETLARAIEVSCGRCNDPVRIFALGDHKKHCFVSKCAIDQQCKWTGISRDLYDHCQIKHKDKCLNGRTHNFEHSLEHGDTNQVNIIDVNGSLLMFHRKFHLGLTIEIFQGVVKHINLQDKDSELSYNLQFTAPHGRGSVMIRKNVRSMSEDVDAIHKLRQGAILHMDQAIDIIQNGSLSYTLTIDTPE